MSGAVQKIWAEQEAKASEYLRKVSDWETMLAQLQEVGARFGIVICLEDVRDALPALWPRIDQQCEQLRQRTKEAFLLRAYGHTERDRHAIEIDSYLKQLVELRQENETLRQRLSTYEPGEVRS